MANDLSRSGRAPLLKSEKLARFSLEENEIEGDHAFGKLSQGKREDLEPGIQEVVLDSSARPVFRLAFVHIRGCHWRSANLIV